MRLVVSGGEVRGDRAAFQRLLDALADRDVSVVFQGVTMRLLEPAEESGSGVLDTPEQA